MRLSKYILQKAQGTLCPECLKTVHLLMQDSNERLPAFYICFFCQSVKQVGVGLVSKDEATIHTQIIDPREVPHESQQEYFGLNKKTAEKDFRELPSESQQEYFRGKK